MLFPTVTFAVFFAVVFVGHRLLLGNRRAWTWFMLVASYVFYGWWNWKFLFLIFASSIIDYLAALKIDSTVGEKARKWWLALSMTAKGGKTVGKGMCRWVQAGGDTAVGEWEMTPAGENLWTWLAGTGKLAGIRGGGTYQWTTSGKAVEAGTSQSCRRDWGKYTLP